MESSAEIPVQNLISRQKLSLIPEEELTSLRLTLEAYERISEASVTNCGSEGCHSKVLKRGVLEENVGCTEMFSCEFEISCGENPKSFCNEHRDANLVIIKQKGGQVWWICNSCHPEKIGSPEFRTWVDLSDYYPMRK